MGIPEFEKGYTETVYSLVKELDGDPQTETITERAGVVRLDDGRMAQIHVTVTTVQDDFLKLTK